MIMITTMVVRILVTMLTVILFFITNNDESNAP